MLQNLGKIGRVAKIGIGAAQRGMGNVAGANGYIDEMARQGMKGVDQVVERAAYVDGVKQSAAAARAGYGKFGQAADIAGDAVGTVARKAGGLVGSPAASMAMTVPFVLPMFMSGGGQAQEQPTPAQAEAMQQQQYLAQAQMQAAQQQQQYQQQQPTQLGYEAALKERLRLAKEERKLQDQQSIINAQQQMYGGY